MTGKYYWGGVCLVFAILLTGRVFGAAPGTMKSSKLEVRFDGQTHEPVEFLNVEMGDRLTLTPVSAFRLEFYKMEGPMAELARQVHNKSAKLSVMDARNCHVLEETQAPDPDGTLVRKIVWEGKQGKVTVTYTLGGDDHFIQKGIRFEPSFTEPYLLWRVEAQRFGFATPPAKYIPFAEGSCLIHFLRGEKSGFFFGVENPLLVPLRVWHTNIFPPIPKEVLMDPAGVNALAYRANYRFSGPYESEKIFWGCYRRTGIIAPKVPIEACPLFTYHCQERYSEIPPDTGESEAMLAMVTRLTSWNPRALAIRMNGWCSGLNKNGYSTVDDVEKDEQVMLDAKKNLGPYEVELASEFGGLQKEVVKLTPSDTTAPTSAAMTQMLSFTRQNGLGVVFGVSHGGPHPWQKLTQYCPSYAPWQYTDYSSGIKYTCTANREFFHWFIHLVVETIRQGYTSYAEDEMPELDAGQVNCKSPQPDFLPGDAGYGWFRLRCELYQRLRAEYGNTVKLTPCRPVQDLGTWEYVYFTDIFDMNEFATPSPDQADQIRYKARIRHYYYFLPGYMDQVLITGYSSIGDGTVGKMLPDSFDDDVMLSALAVSNTYLFYGTGNDTTRKWLDWARAHSEYMSAQSIFLPDWPGTGKCDAYLRLVNGKGFAFIFNSKKPVAAGPSPMDIPLDASVGLDPSTSYTITPIFPEPGNGGMGATEAKGHWTAQLSNGEAMLVSIQPK